MKSSHWNYGLYSMHHKHISYLNKPLSRLLPIRIMGYWSEPSQRSARCAALDENVQCTFCASSFGTHSAAHPLWLAWGLHLETTSLSIQQTFFSFYPYHFYHTYILVFLPLSSQRLWLPWSSHINTLVVNIHIWYPIFSYWYWYWLLQIAPVQANDMMLLNRFLLT